MKNDALTSELEGGLQTSRTCTRLRRHVLLGAHRGDMLPVARVEDARVLVIDDLSGIIEARHGGNGTKE